MRLFDVNKSDKQKIIWNNVVKYVNGMKRFKTTKGKGKNDVEVNGTGWDALIKNG